MKYAILCTQRCGSIYLGSVLRNAGLGVSGEYFYPESLQERIATWWLDEAFRPQPDASPKQFLDAVIRAQGDVAGIKLNWLSLLIFMRDMGCRPEDLGFRIIYLTRRDKLRQAISWYRAVATGEWAQSGQQPATAPPFDWTKINFWLQNITLDEVRWENSLSSVESPVLRLVYEEVSDATVAEVGAFLGREVPPQKRESYLKVQRDETTDHWVEQFLKTVEAPILGSDEIKRELASR